MVAHRFITGHGGVRLHVAVGPAGPGPLLLFLHGFPECWHAWHRQLAAFAGEATVAALDLRGYNESDRPAEVEAYALSKVVADVCVVLRTLSPGRRAIVVGHDWGGITAWRLGHEAAELLSHLVIINAPHPAVFGRELRERGAQRRASSYVAFFQIRGAAEWALQARDFRLLRFMVFDTADRAAVFSPELRAAYLAAWRQPGALRGGLNYYRNRENRDAALRRAAADWTIPGPVTVLWGERDPALLPGNLVGLERLAPHLQIHRHPRATHWIVHEDPEWVNGHLRQVLQEAQA